MRIVLGVSLFGDTQRHQLAKESLVRLSEKFDIELVNLQIPGEKLIEDEKFTTKLLDYSSKEVCKDGKILPMTRNIFDVLASYEADVFIFTNDDIIVSPTFIEHILSTDFDTYSASRMSIKKLDALTDTIEMDDHYQVAGFDVFAIKTSWWNQNKHRFPDYILGYPCWDVHYATLCMKHSNGYLANKWPPPCFHIRHEIVSDEQTPAWEYNQNLYWRGFTADAELWHRYLFNVLQKRPNNYHDVWSNESALEKIYFNENTN